MAPAFVPGAHVVLFGPGYVGEAVCRHLGVSSLSFCRVLLQNLTPRSRNR